MSDAPETLSLVQLSTLIPTEEKAVEHLVSLRWPKEKSCPHCGARSIAEVKTGKPMPYRCRSCRKHFSVRTGTVMQSSKIGVRKWLMAIYLMSVAKKGVSSCQMARQLGVRQATAWLLLHRIREAWNQGRFLLNEEARPMRFTSEARNEEAVIGKSHEQDERLLAE